MKTRVALFVVACVAAAGCTSPEATRGRGGGRGGDVGNRPAEVKMHEGSDPYWHTRVVVPGGAHPSLEAARQAREQSRR